MRILLAHPGASWSTADVYDGLSYGLKAHGCEVISYRLDNRIVMAHKWLHVMWRQKNKSRKAEGLERFPKPTTIDVMYHAGVGVLEMALRKQVDVVLVVSAMLLHPDVVVMMKRAGLRVCVLFTESPYDVEKELTIATLVDGCWTNERTSVKDFLAVNPRSGYLPHGWHPERHGVSAPLADDVPRHDVVFVGSAFPERVTWFNAIDWTGIDLGLYGTWRDETDLGLNAQVQACVKGDQITNEYASALYRRATIGLNLYRSSKFVGAFVPAPITGESLSPRAYELAACGVFHLSEYRPEVPEVFGDLVPTFRTPAEAEGLIRRWLSDDSGRARIAAQLPACVAEASWVERATRVIGDLQRLRQAEVAA